MAPARRGPRFKQSTGNSKDGHFSRSGRPAPLMKRRERTRPQFGWPRKTDSLCPTCVREARARILSGEQSIESLVNDHIAEIEAHIIERDGKVLIEKTCPEHGTFVDTLAINPAFLERLERPVPGPRFRRGHRPPAQSRNVLDQARARRGPDDRPDQSLQHDVRPVLHGREPGGLRPRAQSGRSQETARRRGERQAEAADDGAVLGRRADNLSDLSRRRSVCARGRLLQRPGGHQRHPLRPGSGLRARSTRGRHADRLPAVRRRDRAGQRASKSRQSVRREAARDRGAACREHRRLPRRDDREHGQRRSGRPDHQVRAAELRQDQLRLLPAGLLYGPGRGHPGRRPACEALHAVAPGGGREAADRRYRPAPRLVSAVGLELALRCDGLAERPRRGLGHAQVRLPSGLRDRRPPSW